MEHLREWNKIVRSDKASEESRPKMEYLEMLRYPDRPQPDMNKGILDDLSLSSWVLKVLS